MDDTDGKNANASNTSDSKVIKKSSSNLINEGILAGQKIARISVITLIGIGIVELVTGHVSGSVVATADGIDSLSDAMISFIVLLGLRIAHRPADKKFHFGYHKVESFAAMMAAIGMIIIGCIIVYHSYEALIHPREIKQPIFTMIVLAAAGAISLHRAFQMRVIANQFGFLQMDAIGGMIIAGYIFSVSYISLKQSSLILVDAWQNPKVTELVKRIVEERFKHEHIRVRSVLLRSSGMVAQAEVHMEVDGNKPLTDVELLSIEIEMAIRSKIPTMERVSVIPHSFTLPKSESKRWSGIFGNKNKTISSK